MRNPLKASTPLLKRLTLHPDVTHGKPMSRALRYSVESRVVPEMRNEKP